MVADTDNVSPLSSQVQSEKSPFSFFFLPFSPPSLSRVKDVCACAWLSEMHFSTSEPFGKNVTCLLFSYRDYKIIIIKKNSQ